MVRKILFILSLLLLAGFHTEQAHAGTLSPASDRLTTSRPSASAPISANQAASDNYVTITDLSDNIMYLASDSAVLFSDTGQTLNSVTVSSASAADTPSSNIRTIFFTSAITNTHHAGTALFAPISAMHEVTFQTPTALLSGQSIFLKFPSLTSGDANNPASPSATTFQFNGLADAQIEIWDDGGEISPTITVTDPTAGTPPKIEFELGAAVAAGSTIKIFLGCTVSSSTACTTSSPRMINPTQGTIANGTSRNWTLTIETRDASAGEGIIIDDTKVRISTIGAVLVQATVDAFLSVTIAGLNGDFASTVTGCPTESPNGVSSTATSVNLGVLGSGNISKAAQSIEVDTNAQFGYVITATSSGQFKDPSTGSIIIDVHGGTGLTANDTPVAAVPPASGNPFFGIFPCGSRVSDATYSDNNAVAFAGTSKGTNPWNTGVNSYYATIASYAGPGVADDLTGIRYASSVSPTTPAGLYRTVFTYVVTATF